MPVIKSSSFPAATGSIIPQLLHFATINVSCLDYFFIAAINTNRYFLFPFMLRIIPSATDRPAAMIA